MAHQILSITNLRSVIDLCMHASLSASMQILPASMISNCLPHLAAIFSVVLRMTSLAGGVVPCGVSVL